MRRVCPQGQPGHWALGFSVLSPEADVVNIDHLWNSFSAGLTVEVLLFFSSN